MSKSYGEMSGLIGRTVGSGLLKILDLFITPVGGAQRLYIRCQCTTCGHLETCEYHQTQIGLAGGHDCEKI